ncbi:MAG TPA: tRNA 2-thiouridine(34) synthase MnmA [Fibrobacteria bacterium]|nr:tRNA 2-thiouridine(34) synthase MnmA [Fibrobacteria bacterium]
MPAASKPPQDILVAVAMSGGVDSSVAALLLQRQGYRVVGLTMKLWSPPASQGSCDDDKTCCTADSAMDAKRVCDQLGIPHYTLDMQDDFEERVIRPFYEAYLHGETPNPCVNCNSFVKWDALWKRARAIGADRIATGHYAATAREGEDVYILRADPIKDQSYFLWGIPPESLAETLFPLSGLSKPEVRALAAEMNLRTANKRESQDICFVPDGDYREVVAARARAEGREIPAGEFVGPGGESLGAHRGIPYYTVGQRKGLGIATGEPLFVRKLDTATGEVVLGRKDELYSRAFVADRFNGFGPDWRVGSARGCLVQYRYRSPAVPALVERQADGRAHVTLREPGYCIAPGQSAVFYDGDRLLGGARIRETLA